MILLDNLGYSASKTFGGAINMPTLERLAANGLVYTDFHVNPLLLANAHVAPDRPQLS